jgi:hypothetical protein
MTLATNDYNFGSLDDECTGFSTGGPDLVYVINVPAGQTLTAVLGSEEFDSSLYLTSTCPFSSVGQCLAGTDANFFGEGETLSFVQGPTGGDVYVVVDAAFGGGGEFTLTATVQ